MKVVLRAVQKKKNAIPEDILPIFEDIVQRHEEKLGSHLIGLSCVQPGWDDDFSIAMSELLTKEQRYRLYEEVGACNGAGADKERKLFARDYATCPLKIGWRCLRRLLADVSLC